MALQEEFKTQGDFLFKYRSFLPLIILVLGLAVYIYGICTSNTTEATAWTGCYEYICLGVSLFGLLIRILTVGYTPANTSGRNTTEGQIADVLNTTGIYSTVRHPLYVGNFFMWLGVGMLTANTWFVIAFVLFYAFYYERIMYAEESFLRGKFGDMYLDWAKGLPAFIPSFKNYVKPSIGFSIKKVLKKEKNGLAAVFSLFWVFKEIGDYVINQDIVIEYDFWFYVAVGTGVLYFILKIMKKRKMFEEAGR